MKEGRIIRPYIGVSYSLISPEIAELRDFPEGAYVSRVIPDSPADKAGIVRGDVITSLDGEAVTETSSLGALIRKRTVGETLPLVIERDGKKIQVNVTLEEAPVAVQ